MKKHFNIALIIGAFLNENAVKNKVTIITSSDPIDNLTSNEALTAEAKMRIAASGKAVTSKNVRGLYGIHESVASKLMNVDTLSTDASNPTMFPNPISGIELFGFEISNCVVETTELRPNSNPEKVRKMNPTTGELLTYQGKQIYRYVDVIPAEMFENHVLLTSDQTVARQQGVSPAPAAAEQ